MGSCRKRWSDLSGDEEREIMRRLPLKRAFALREVCKSWNNTLSSPTLWGPCILLSPAKPTLPSLLYSLSSPLCLSMEWQALQLRIPQHQKLVMGKPRETVVLHRGSSQGILLVQMASHLAFGMAMCTTNNLHVCNPLTGNSTKVSDSYGVSKYVAHGIMVAGSGLGTWVAMMAKTNQDDTLVVQVMRTNTTASWYSTMVNVPPEVCTASSRMVLCNSSCGKILRLFCLVKTALVDDKDGSGGGGGGSGGFDAVLTMEMHMTDFSNKKCGLVSLPKVLANNGGGLMSLFCCGRSAAMLATGVENIKGCIHEVVIWELRYRDGCDPFWVNVDTMPRLVMSAMMNGRDWGKDERMCTSSPWMECVGVGEYCCFRAHESNRIAAFHAKTKRWECLPCFPENYRYLHLTSMEFHPSTTSPL